MKIIYIHGFNSNSNNELGTYLKSKYDAISVDYEFQNAHLSFNKLKSIIDSNLKEDIILIGTSLGGFWANYMAEYYEYPCIIINPPLNPYTSLYKYLNVKLNNNTIFDNKCLNSYKNWFTTKTKGLYKTILLGAKDNVINYKWAADYFKDYNVVILPNEGHRITDYSPIDKYIDECKNFICDFDDDPSDFNDINENFKNIFSDEDKLKWIDQVWSLLQKTYSKIGGNLSFKTKEDLLNTKMWKLYTDENGKVITFSIYDDKNGRKGIASGTDGSTKSKDLYLKINMEDLLLNRSYKEISGPSLAFLVKNFNIENYLIHPDDVSKILNKEIFKPNPDDPYLLKYPQYKDYFYSRYIRNEYVTKIMIGKPNKKFY